MRRWIAFLALAALSSQATAAEKAPPEPTQAAENSGTGRKCPPPTDYKIFQRKGEAFVETTTFTLPQPEPDIETSFSSVTDHQPRPDVTENEDKTEMNTDSFQNGSKGERWELVNSSYHVPEQERSSEQTHLQKPELDRNEPQDQNDTEQKSEQERQDSTGQPKDVMDQSEDINNTTSRVPSDECSHQIEQGSEVAQNETEEDSAADCDSPPHSTDAATTTMPLTTQEPTTVTTEDPNWCRKNGFVKPWPQCIEEAGQNFTKNLAEELTRFSLKLFQQVLKKDRTANVVFSPLSIALVLSQLLLGARGDMKDNLMKTLFDLENSNAADCVHSTLRSMVTSTGFESASGMFYQKDLTMNPFFLNQSEEFYNVIPQPFTESSSDNLEMVNKWAAQHTKNRIKKLLSEIPENVRLLLLNAIFFQGKWKTQFDPKETVKESFWGSSKKVQMMTSKKYPLVSASDAILKARVARFPLSDDMSMLILLPQIGHLPLTETEDKLTSEVFQAILGKLDRAQVNPTMVSLPRFKVDSAQDLVALFSHVGLSELFGVSNLCGISDAEDLMVSGGQHRAVLQMDETGVVAAAATAVSLARTVYVFEVRHPFLFVVWSEQSRIPVMMGRITDPTRA